MFWRYGGLCRFVYRLAELVQKHVMSDMWDQTNKTRSQEDTRCQAVAQTEQRQCSPEASFLLLLLPPTPMQRADDGEREKGAHEQDAEKQKRADSFGKVYVHDDVEHVCLKPRFSTNW